MYDRIDSRDCLISILLNAIIPPTHLPDNTATSSKHKKKSNTGRPTIKTAISTIW